jgi:hypothetical protein
MEIQGDTGRYREIQGDIGRPLEEVDAPAVDAAERALEVSVLVRAHGRQPTQAVVAVRDLMALEHLAGGL